MSDPEAQPKKDPVDVERFIDAFNIFEAMFIPHGASEEQREAMMRAFFAGGAMVVGTVQKQIADGFSIGQLKEAADYMQADMMSELALRDARSH